MFKVSGSETVKCRTKTKRTAPRGAARLLSVALITILLIGSLGGANGRGVLKAYADEPSVENAAGDKLELVDKGYRAYIDYSAKTIYVYYCGIVHNPSNKVAMFPKVEITAVDSDDGKVLGHGSTLDFRIMPGDTVAISDSFAFGFDKSSGSAQLQVTVSDNGFRDSVAYCNARSTDFSITDLAEISDLAHPITGKITNNFSEDATSVNLTLLLRKNGSIVYSNSTSVDGLKAGETKEFSFWRNQRIPKYDSVEVLANAW